LKQRPVGRCRFLEENESGLRFRRNNIWRFTTECTAPYNRPSANSAPENQVPSNDFITFSRQCAYARYKVRRHILTSTENSMKLVIFWGGTRKYTWQVKLDTDSCPEGELAGKLVSNIAEIAVLVARTGKLKSLPYRTHLLWLFRKALTSDQLESCQLTEAQSC